MPCVSDIFLGYAYSGHSACPKTLRTQSTDPHIQLQHSPELSAIYSDQLQTQQLNSHVAALVPAEVNRYLRPWPNLQVTLANPQRKKYRIVPIQPARPRINPTYQLVVPHPPTLSLLKLLVLGLFVVTTILVINQLLLVQELAQVQSLLATLQKQVQLALLRPAPDPDQHAKEAVLAAAGQNHTLL